MEVCVELWYLAKMSSVRMHVTDAVATKSEWMHLLRELQLDPTRAEITYLSDPHTRYSVNQLSSEFMTNLVESIAISQNLTETASMRLVFRAYSRIPPSTPSSAAAAVAAAAAAAVSTTFTKDSSAKAAISTLVLDPSSPTMDASKSDKFADNEAASSLSSLKTGTVSSAADGRETSGKGGGFDHVLSRLNATLQAKMSPMQIGNGAAASGSLLDRSLVIWTNTSLTCIRDLYALHEFVNLQPGDEIPPQKITTMLQTVFPAFESELTRWSPSDLRLVSAFLNMAYTVYRYSPA